MTSSQSRSSVNNGTHDRSTRADAARLRVVRELHPEVECAVAIEHLQLQVVQLWLDSMNSHDRAMSQRLAEVSHALQRGARLLAPDGTLG
jgi:hypothetical protein